MSNVKIYSNVGFYNHSEIVKPETKRLTLDRTKIKCKQPTMVKLPYWQLDNTIVDKTTGQRTILKKKVAVKTDDDRYEYKPFTYDAIAKSDTFSQLKVLTTKGVLTVKECIDAHKERKALILRTPDADLRYKYILKAADLKNKIDKALDRESRLRVKSAIDAQWTVEKRLNMAEELYKKGSDEPHGKDMKHHEILSKHAKPTKYVACYPYVPDGKVSMSNPLGLDQPASCNYHRFTGNFINYYGEVESYDVLYEGFVFNTNSHLKFDDVIAVNSTVYKTIAKAKKWGYTPNTEEGFYTIDGWESEQKGNVTMHTPIGVRGMCVTREAFEELQAIVNYCEALAEQGVDLSDEKTLLHPNGVDTITITEHEYEKNRDKYDEWRDAAEPRDYQVGLLSGDDEMDEYEKAADILDD